MRVYSIAPAKDQLSRLVDEAIAGEQVTITRHGKPVVELRPAVAGGPGRPPADLIDELARRAKALTPLGRSTVDLVRRMRDEDR